MCGVAEEKDVRMSGSRPDGDHDVARAEARSAFIETRRAAEGEALVGRWRLLQAMMCSGMDPTPGYVRGERRRRAG